MGPGGAPAFAATGRSGIGVWPVIAPEHQGDVVESEHQNEADTSGEPEWADQYRGLTQQLAEAQATVQGTRPTELIKMSHEHVDALWAQAQLAQELHQIAKKFLIEEDSPPPPSV
jgi:hypothetical protein